jgi:hypothetical protein
VQRRRAELTIDEISEYELRSPAAAPDGIGLTPEREAALLAG